MPQPEKKSDAAEPKKKSDAASSEKPETVGEPLAPGMMKLLRDEIVAGIRGRGITDRFARFQSYAAGRVSATAAAYTGSELTGNCRLRWYNHLMRNMLDAPAEAEQFTRELHMAVRNDHDGLAQVLAIAAAKMDAGQRKPRKYAASDLGPTGARDHQASADRSSSFLRRGPGAAEQVGDRASCRRIWCPSSPRRITWATRWSIAGRAGGSAT